MSVLFSIVEGTTAPRGPFKLWVQQQPEALPPGETSPVIPPVPLDLTGKTVTLIARKPDGTLATSVGTCTPRPDQSVGSADRGVFDFTPGAGLAYIEARNHTAVSIYTGHWKVVTTIGGAVDFWPDDQFEIEVRRA